MINVSRISTAATPPPPAVPTPSSMPHADLLAPPKGPARDRVRPLLPADVRDRLPQDAFDVRIGKGTVASEFDRNVRVRLVGDGPPSQRTIQPETTLTKRLLASPAGPSFEKLVRKTAGVADAAQGNDDLKTLTFAPDEHATKAAEFMNHIIGYAKDHPNEPVTFTKTKDPKIERMVAQLLVKERTREIPAELRFAAAWNGAGNILVTPDISRELFATIGAYKFQDGDRILKQTPKERDAILRDDWYVLAHEAHHSVSSLNDYTKNEKVNILEEAVSSVLGTNQRWQAARGAGADIKDTANNPENLVDKAKLGWKSWNRDHLPAPPHDRVETAGARYFSGPDALRDLLKMAGVDMRTTVGKKTAFQLLQSKDSAHVPKLLATAIAEQHGMPESSVKSLTKAVLDSMSDGTKAVRALIPKGVSAT